LVGDDPPPSFGRGSLQSSKEPRDCTSQDPTSLATAEPEVKYSEAMGHDYWWGTELVTVTLHTFHSQKYEKLDL
jgi:hypothetical protein